MITLLIFIQSLITWLDFCYTADARHRLRINVPLPAGQTPVFPAPELRAILEQIHAPHVELVVAGDIRAGWTRACLGAILEQIHAAHVDLVVAGDIRAVGEPAVGTPGRVGRGRAFEGGVAAVGDACGQGSRVSGRGRAAGEGDVGVAEDGEGLVAVVEADLGDAEEGAGGAGGGVGEEGDVVVSMRGGAG